MGAAEDSSGTHFPSTISYPSGHSSELAGCSDEEAGATSELVVSSLEEAAAELGAESCSEDEGAVDDAAGALEDGS